MADELLPLEVGDVRRWAVVYRRPRHASSVWAIVDGVPRAVKTPAVREAVEQSVWWPRWQRRLTAQGSVSFVVEGSSMWDRHVRDAGVWDAVPLKWYALQPEERRITVAVDSPLWALCRARAADAGVPLAEWVRGVLTEAVAS